MGYSNMLQKIVAESDFTLREIADKCREKGVNIDPSYISKLQTGKQPPASEEVSRTIAEVCGADADSLVLEGYLEKAPEPIRNFVRQVVDFFTIFFKEVVAPNLPDSNSPYVNMFLNLTPFEKVQFFNEYFSGKLEKKIDSIYTFRGESGDQITRVPDMGVPVTDDSMSPLIPLGAKVNVEPPRECKNGDLVFAVLPGEKQVVRRFLRVEGKIVLLPENPSYEPLIVDMDQFVVAGMVKSFTVDLPRR